MQCKNDYAYFANAPRHSEHDEANKFINKLNVKVERRMILVLLHRKKTSFDFQ